MSLSLRKYTKKVSQVQVNICTVSKGEATEHSTLSYGVQVTKYKLQVLNTRCKFHPTYPHLQIVDSTLERKYGSLNWKMSALCIQRRREMNRQKEKSVLVLGFTLRYVQSSPVHDVRHPCNAKMVQSRANLRPRLPSYTCHTHD